MEFDRNLHQLQACIFNTLKVLESLPDSRSEIEISRMLADEVKKVVEKWPDKYEPRKVGLYLVCNCDLESLNSLSDDLLVGHIIGTAPCLDKKVVFHALLDLGSITFLRELITFGPPLLSADLLETFFLISDSLTPNLIVDICTESLKACFHKLALSGSESFRVQWKFYEYFSRLMNLMCTCRPDTKSTSTEFAGKLIFSFLDVCSFCVNDLKESTDCWECFLMHCDFIMEEWSLPSCEECSLDKLLWLCRDHVISGSMIILSGVTLDMWMSWVEIDMEPSFTLQQKVGEAAYVCSKQLETVVGAEFASHSNLRSLLTQFSLKPKSEDDDVQEASLQTIIENLADENRNRKIWMKGLLLQEQTLDSLYSISAVEKNSTLMDEDDVLYLLARSCTKLEDSVNFAFKENIQNLTLHVMKHLPLESLVKILTKHVSAHASSEILCTAQFSTLLTSAFNKVIDSEDCGNQVWCEALQLCILNPKAVLESALKMGLEGHKQSTILMLDFLILLKPISTSFVIDWLSNLQPLYLDSAAQVKSFPQFVSSLIESGMLDFEFFLTKCVMPALHGAVSSEQWSSAVMWISSLQLSLNCQDICSMRSFKVAPLLAFFVQLLGRCHQAIRSFSLSRLEVRSSAISVLHMLEKLVLGDSERAWLSSLIMNHPPTVSCYFKAFVIESTKSSSNENSIANSLKYCFPMNVKCTEFAACIMFEILPSLTMEEWKCIATLLKDILVVEDDKSWAVFQVFRQSMILIGAVSIDDAVDLKDQHLSCLNYCVRCFGSVIKDEILNTLNKSYYITIFIETMLVLCCFPSSVWDESAIFLSPVLLQLIEFIPHNTCTKNLLNAVFQKCPYTAFRTLVEMKVSEKLNESIENVEF